MTDDSEEGFEATQMQVKTNDDRMHSSLNTDYK
jgi:hypothetical protein